MDGNSSQSRYPTPRRSSIQGLVHPIWIGSHHTGTNIGNMSGQHPTTDSHGHQLLERQPQDSQEHPAGHPRAVIFFFCITRDGSWAVKTSPSKISPYMKIQAIEPNAKKNLGLVNHQKIRLCCPTIVLHFIFKNNVTRTSYTLFQPDREQFVYIDKISGREITCGLILFKISICVMRLTLSARTDSSSTIKGGLPYVSTNLPRPDALTFLMLLIVRTASGLNTMENLTQASSSSI